MSSNTSGPRKFSEKIALLNQKQAEQDAAYCSIMDEIKSIKTPQPENLSIRQSVSLAATGSSNKTRNRSIKNINLVNKTSNIQETNVFIDDIHNNHHINKIQNEILFNNQLDRLFDTKINDHSNNTENNKITDNNNSFYLQLPYQNDSFRRAQSDPSLNQIVNNLNGNTNTNGFEHTNNHHQQQHQHEFNQQHQNYEVLNLKKENDLNVLHNNENTSFQIHLQHAHNNQQIHHHQQNHQHRQQQHHQQQQTYKNSNSLAPNHFTTHFNSLPDLSSFDFVQQDANIQQINNEFIPNIPQHNHIGPVRPTQSSISPSRIARYSPTHSPNRRPSPSRYDEQYKPSRHEHRANSFSHSYTPTSPLTNGVLRNVVNPTESLPPSPQSQQSCFNSPQGSPSPLLSPQDINSYTTNASPQNGYDSIQKKFDQINLDTSHHQAQFMSFKKSASQPQNISNNNIITSNARKSSADLSISYQVPQVQQQAQTQIQQTVNYVNNYQLNKQQQNEIIHTEQPIYDSLFNNNNNIFKNTINNNQPCDDNFFFHSSHIRKIHNSIPDIILTCPDPTDEDDKSDDLKEFTDSLDTKTDELIDFEALEVGSIRTFIFNDTKYT